jgi:hypothetical protein
VARDLGEHARQGGGRLRERSYALRGLWGSPPEAWLGARARLTPAQGARAVPLAGRGTAVVTPQVFNYCH